MKGSIQSNNCNAFVVEHDVDMLHQYSSKKELSKGFAASQSSSFLDETASNSSLSSSCFSLSSAISLNYLSERPSPLNSKGSLVTTPNAVPVVSRLPSLSKVSTGANKIQNGGVQRFRYRRLSPQTLLQIVSFKRDEVVWEEVEDNLYILLDGRLDRLKICEEFFFQRNGQNEGRLEPRRSCEFLWSLSYLLSSKHENMAVHDEHVSRLACFLSTGRDARHLKLAFVRTLYEMFLSSPESEVHAGKINNPGSHGGAERLYEFVTNRAREWDDDFTDKLSTLAIGLVYEIRAKCLRNLDLETDRIRSVTDKGDNTAVIIAMGAKALELGIQKSNKAIEGQISNAGQKMKAWIDDLNVKSEQQSKQESRMLSNTSDRDAVVVRTVCSSTKRASEYARLSSNLVARSTLDTTLSGLYTIGNKVEESTDRIDQLSPESREMIKAAGKIGVASVGAVALVAEAVIETSRSLSSKTVGMTADIVGHKYGSVAGEVARDAAETYTNVLETMGNINLASNGSKLVKKAAKNAGKNQIDEDVEKAKQIIQKLESHGAIVAQQTLGIQWKEGTLTRELLCAAAADGYTLESALLQPKGNLTMDNNNKKIGK